MPFVLLLALFDGATFGLIVDNRFNIDGAIFVVALMVDGFVGISVLLTNLVGVVVIVVVVVVVGVNGGSTKFVLLTDFDRFGIGITAFDVTFSL